MMRPQYHRFVDGILTRGTAILMIALRLVASLAQFVEPQAAMVYSGTTEPFSKCLPSELLRLASNSGIRAALGVSQH